MDPNEFYLKDSIASKEGDLHSLYYDDLYHKNQATSKKKHPALKSVAGNRQLGISGSTVMA